jgi:hypothetical protein
MRFPMLVAIHVRRGDMLPQLKADFGGKEVAQKSYYDKAKQYMVDFFKSNETLFLVQSDDLEWAKCLLDENTFIVETNNELPLEVIIIIT